MTRGGQVFRSCKISKQTYIIAQKTRSPSDGEHRIYWLLHFDVVDVDGGELQWLSHNHIIIRLVLCMIMIINLCRCKPGGGLIHQIISSRFEHMFDKKLDPIE